MYNAISNNTKNYYIKMEKITEFGMRLNNVKKRFGHTNESLARLLGMSQSMIQKYITGGHHMPLERVEALCKEFGISKEWLINGVGEMIDVDGSSGNPVVRARLISNQFIDIIFDKIDNLERRLEVLEEKLHT